MIHGMANVHVMFPDPSTGKPYLRVTLGDTEIDLTTNVAEMIGGAAKGTRERFEEHPESFDSILEHRMELDGEPNPSIYAERKKRNG